MNPVPTPREIELASLLSLGYQQKDVAYSLNISPKTVSSHLNRLHRRLKVHTTGHLVRLMIERGYIHVQIARPSDPPAEAENKTTNTERENNNARRTNPDPAPVCSFCGGVLNDARGTCTHPAAVYGGDVNARGTDLSTAAVHSVLVTN